MLSLIQPFTQVSTLSHTCVSSVSIRWAKALLSATIRFTNAVLSVTMRFAKVRLSACILSAKTVLSVTILFTKAVLSVTIRFTRSRLSVRIFVRITSRLSWMLFRTIVSTALFIAEFAADKESSTTRFTLSRMFGLFWM